MSHYHNDQPITGTEDTPDCLNRESFAEHLAEILILEPEDDCLTVSLEGEWGYGKTSVINLVKKYCKQHTQKPVIVEYNPWLSGKAEALIQDFLVQFSSQLDMPDRPKEGLKVAKELLAYSKLFSAMKLIPGVEPWASTIESVFKSVGESTEEISKLKEVNLLGRKNKVKDALADLNQSLIVVIDDIDRLTPDEAFQVIRLVKAVADFPGTSFLLAFDPEYLTSVLEVHGIGKSDQYIDKVVQLRVPLPLIGCNDMQKLADIELNSLSDTELTQHFEEDQDRLGLLYHSHIKYIVRSPRELKRLFNHLRFVFKQTEGMVCFTDLYSLSVLAIKAPSIYRHIKETPGAYVGRNFDEQLNMEKPEIIVGKYKDERTKVLKSCPSKDVGHISEIISNVFPLVDGGEYFSQEDEYDKLGRIASPQRLYIALHYQVPTDYAADTDVVLFINGDIDRHEYVQGAISENFVERFFELLSQNIDKIAEENTISLLQAIFDIFLPSEYLQQFEEAEASFFGFEPFRNIRWITFDLIKRSNKKIELIDQLVSEKDYVFITADIIRKLLVQFGEVETTEPRERKEQWIDGDSYTKIKDKWVDVAIMGIENGEILDSVLASHVYATLSRADLQKTQNLLTRVLGQKSGVGKIAKLIGRSGSDSINGPYSQITEDNSSAVYDFSVLQNAAKEELEFGEELSPYLKAVYQSIITGDKYYLRDASKGEKF